VSDADVAAPGAARRVAYNTAVQLAGKAVILGLGAASVAVATRYLGAASYGRFALALAFVQMLGVLADVGLVTTTVREISKAPERATELVGNALVLRLALALSVVALAVALSLVLPYAPEVRVAIAIAGVPFVLGLVNGTVVAVLQARLLMDRATVADVVGRAAGLGALVAVVALDLGFQAVVWSVAVGAAVTLAVTLLVSRRLVELRPAADRRVWRELLAAGIPLGVTLAVNEIYFRADIFIISLFRDFDEVGAYSLGFRIIELLAVLPAVLMISVFPLLSRYLTQGREAARRTMEAAGDVLLAVGLPLAAGGLVLAPELVRLVAGDAFDEAATPLRILLFAGALAWISGLFGYALVAGGRQVSTLRLSLAALGLNLALNLALVPTFGIDAAAATAVASEVLLVAGGLVLVRRHLGIAPRFELLVRAAVAATVMALALWLLRDLPLGALLALGSLLYLGALAALGGLDRDRLRELRA
jgi:O-antigen/teichoic acid export membrane protein